MENYLSIAYHCKCFNVCFDKKINVHSNPIKEYFLKELSDAIDELNILDDSMLHACGYFQNLYELLYQHDEYLIKEFLKNAKVTLGYNGDVREFDVSNCLSDVWEYRYLHDCCDTGRAMNLIAESIELFLNRAMKKIPQKL